MFFQKYFIELFAIATMQCMVWRHFSQFVIKVLVVENLEKNMKTSETFFQILTNYVKILLQSNNISF